MDPYIDNAKNEDDYALAQIEMFVMTKMAKLLHYNLHSLLFIKLQRQQE